MKKSVFYLCCLSVFILSCNEQTNKNGNYIEPVEPTLVKTLVQNNDYIDVDKVALSIKEKESGNDNSVDNAKVRAAYYRFFHHIKLVDGRFVCDITDAKEINVSPRLFNAMLKEIEEINIAIEDAKKQNIPITIPELDEEYLQSLLE